MAGAGLQTGMSHIDKERKECFVVLKENILQPSLTSKCVLAMFVHCAIVSS